MKLRKAIKVTFWTLHLLLIKVILGDDFSALIPVVIAYIVLGLLVSVVEFNEEREKPLYIKKYL